MVSCPAYPAGHSRAETPAYDALVQASSGQMWAQPGWRPGPIFLHMPVPSMGAAFLVAAGALAALSARERTGRGQQVETSLFQGALLYTTQLYQDVEKPGPGYHELMAKTYPPGIHQTMLFECAAGGWVHIWPRAASASRPIPPRRGCWSINCGSFPWATTTTAPTPWKWRCAWPQKCSRRRPSATA